MNIICLIEFIPSSTKVNPQNDPLKGAVLSVETPGICLKSVAFLSKQDVLSILGAAYSAVPVEKRNSSAILSQTVRSQLVSCSPFARLIYFMFICRFALEVCRVSFRLILPLYSLAISCYS